MSDSLPSPAPAPVEYPESDGRPMAETPVHRDCIIDAIGVLRGFFAGRADVYVSGDMFVYYEEGNPRASVVPDVFVAVGVVKDERREGGWRNTYKLWEEAKGPDFVLEVTSRSTRRDDQVRKRALYARLGVGEYFLYDPKGEYLAPPLQGMVLRGGGYEELEAVRLAHGTEGVWSEALGLYVCHRGWGKLRLHDPASGRDLRTHGEETAARRAEAEARQAAEARAVGEAEARRAAEARAAGEAEARRAAEARIAELEALLSSGGVPASPQKGPD